MDNLLLDFVVHSGRDSDRRRSLHLRLCAAVVWDWRPGSSLAGIIGIDNLGIQFLIFALVSVGLTAASRTIFVNYFSREKTGDSLRTGVDSLPGKIGTVVSSSRGAMQEGAVKVFGSTWTLIRRKANQRWKQANACAWRVLKARRSMCDASMKESDWRAS